MSLFSPETLVDHVARRLAQRPAATTGWLIALSVVGALVPACAVYVGTRYLTTAWDFELGYTPVSEGRIDPFRATLFGLLAAPWLIATVATLVAPLYDRPRQPRAAFAAAVIGTAPLYLACSFMFFMPAILLVGLAFIVSCNWWGCAGQRLLGIDSGRSAELTAVSLLGASVMLQFAGGWLSGLL
jgi:hypothetical protein